MPSASAYEPDVQFVHETALVKLYLPEPQMVQFIARPALAVPALQLVHAMAPLVCPVANPLGHFRHESVNETGA